MGKFFSHTPQGQDSNPHGPYVLKYLCSQELNQLLARTSASRGHISSGNDSQLELGHIIKSGTIRDRNQVKHPIPSLAEFHALQERTGSTDGVSQHTNYSSRNKNFRLFSAAFGWVHLSKLVGVAPLASALMDTNQSAHRNSINCKQRSPQRTLSSRSQRGHFSDHPLVSWEHPLCRPTL